VPALATKPEPVSLPARAALLPRVPVVLTPFQPSARWPLSVLLTQFQPSAQ
jgi:hypothetical protein